MCLLDTMCGEAGVGAVIAGKCVALGDVGDAGADEMTGADMELDIVALPVSSPKPSARGHSVDRQRRLSRLKLQAAV